MIHYFAYGSNLHPVRLLDRISSARLIGAVKLHEHQITFRKRSSDGSSKCNLIHTGEPSDSMQGAIYALAPEHRSVLDGFEGKGLGYMDNQIELQYQGRVYPCFTYFAQHSHIVENLKPYHWYKELVVLGASYLKFPEPYILSLKSVESCEDPDSKRRKEHEILLQKIRHHR